MLQSPCGQNNTSAYSACQQVIASRASHNIEILYTFWAHSYNGLSLACITYNPYTACGLWKQLGLEIYFSCDSKNMLISASDGPSVVKSHEGDICISRMLLGREWSPFHTCVVFWWSAPILDSWMKSGLSPLWVQKVWRQISATLEYETSHHIIHMRFFPGSITFFCLCLSSILPLYPQKIPLW